MLEFRLNNRNFALDSSARVRLNWKNPACMISEFPGDIGMGIEIPVNDLNRALLGSPERFEKLSHPGDREFYGFEVRYEGYLLMSGTLVINSANNTTYSGWLRSHLGNLGKEQREKYINEMPWPTNQQFTFKTITSFPDDDYAAPMLKNRVFWEGKGRMVKKTTAYRDENGEWQDREEEIEYLSEKFREQNNFFVNHRIDGSFKINEGAVISPMLYLKYIVKHIFNMSGWYIARNDWDTTDGMDNLVLYNNFNIIRPLPVYENETRYEWDRNGLLKEEVIKRIIKSVVWQVGNFDYKDLIPKVKMKDFILGLQNYLNFVFHFRDDKKVSIIDRNSILSRQGIDIDEFLVNEWAIGDRISRRLKFISKYDENDGYQGDNWQDLSDRIDDFAGAVETYDDLQAIEDPQIGELRLVRSENKIYEWKWGVNTNETEYQDEPIQEDVLGWEFVSTGPQPYLYGEGDNLEEINTCFSTLVMETEFAGWWPGVRQHGNIGIMRSLWSDFSPRLIFNTIMGAHISNGLVNLNWDGNKGLVATRWNNWIRFWKDRLPVEASFYFPVNSIDFVKNNIYEPFRTRHGKFIIEEMETEFGLHEIGETRIKGYKV